MIPHDYFLFSGNKKNWNEVFRFNQYNGYGPSDISKALIKDYGKSIYYPENLFEPNDFIAYDGHLTKSGNEKLERFSRKLLNQ